MKAIVSFFFYIITLHFCQGQNYVPVVFRVVDGATNKSIAGAQISVRQAGWATKATGSDGKATFDNIPEGAINYIITKEGYVMYEGDENVSLDTRSNTFQIKLVAIPKSLNKLLLTGEVIDETGKDIGGVTVEVKAAKDIYTCITDKSGNYFVEITLSTEFTITNLIVEAKMGECKARHVLDIPRNNILSKDLILKCNDLAQSKLNDSPNQPKNVNFGTNNGVIGDYATVNTPLQPHPDQTHVEEFLRRHPNKDAIYRIYYRSDSRMSNIFATELISLLKKEGYKDVGSVIDLSNQMFADTPGIHQMKSDESGEIRYFIQIEK